MTPPVRNRTLSLQAGHTFLEPYSIQNGIPQDSIISVTLFLLAIDDKSSNIHFPISKRLSTDSFTMLTQQELIDRFKKSSTD